MRLALGVQFDPAWWFDPGPFRARGGPEKNVVSGFCRKKRRKEKRTREEGKKKKGKEHNRWLATAETEAFVTASCLSALPRVAREGTPPAWFGDIYDDRNCQRWITILVASAKRYPSGISRHAGTPRSVRHQSPEKWQCPERPETRPGKCERSPPSPAKEGQESLLCLSASASDLRYAATDSPPIDTDTLLFFSLPYPSLEIPCDRDKMKTWINNNARVWMELIKYEQVTRGLVSDVSSVVYRMRVMMECGRKRNTSMMPPMRH